MKVDKFLRFFVFAVMLSGTTNYALADEATFTFNNKSSITCPSNVTCTNFSGFSTNILGHCYLQGKHTGVVEFTNFKYDVSKIQWYRCYDELNDYTAIGRTSAYDKKGNIVNSDSEGDEFNFTRWTDGTQLSACSFATLKNGSCAGLSKFVIKETNGHDVRIVKIVVTYDNPTIAFTSNLPAALHVNESATIALSDLLKFTAHQGAFSINTTDIDIETTGGLTYDKATGTLTAPSSATTASITAILKNNGVEVTRVTKNITIYSGNYSWVEGDLYMDYNNSNNPNTAYFQDGSTKGLRLYVDYTPYRWESFTQGGSDGSLDLSIKTTESTKKWRVGLGMFSYTQYVPAYSDVCMNYTFAITSEKSISETYPSHGAEAINIGNKCWNESSEDQFSTGASFSTLSSPMSSIVSVMTTDKSKFNQNYWPPVTISASNKYNATGFSTSEYFALKTYIRNLNNNAEHIGSLKATRKDDCYIRYYAYITYDSNNGSGDKSENVELCADNKKSAKLQKNSFSYSGYKFLGWSTSPNGDVVYEDEGAFCPYDATNDCGLGYGTTLYAKWEPKTTIVSFDANGGTMNQSADYTIRLTQDKVISYANYYNCGVTAQKSGYTFDGWYDSKSADATLVFAAKGQTLNTKYWGSADVGICWKAGDNETMTVYAGYSCSVTLNLNNSNAKWSDNTTDNKTISPKYGFVMPSLSVTPTSSNSSETFDGFYTNADGTGTQYYNAKMESSHVWDQEQGCTLYAHWVTNAASTTLITIDANGGKLPEQSNFYLDGTPAGSKLVSYDTTNRESCSYYMYYNYKTNKEIDNCSNGGWNKQVFSKPGYRLVGLYAGNVKVYALSNNPAIITYVPGKYWSNNGEWLGTEAELQLRAEYAPIYSNNINSNHQIIFYNKNSNPQDGFTNVFYAERNNIANFIFDADDMRAAILNTEGAGIDADIDIIDFYTYNDQSIANDNINPIMAVVEEYKTANQISKNVLTYHQGTPASTTYKNVCYYHHDDTSDDGTVEPVFQTAGGIKVTDREPMTVKYKVIACDTEYDRIMSNLGSKAKWGTICLPFDVNIKYMTSSISFYKLQGVTSSDGESVGKMSFASYTPPYDSRISGNVIKANTPLIYHVNEVGGGSDGVYVHQNTGGNWGLAFYMPVSAHEDQHAEESTYVDGWELIGTRTNRTFHGKSASGSDDIHNYYLGNHPEYDAIYYITYDTSKGDNGDVFCYVTDDYTVTSPAYRAYFAHSAKAESKASFYTLMVYDEDGEVTDITDLLDNENAVGDGKIYDLNGVRVKNPIKGHIYIVNGKKKVY